MGTGTPVGRPPEPPTASAAARTTSGLTTSALSRRRLLAAAVAIVLVLALLAAWALAHRGAGVPAGRASAAPGSVVQPASPGAASAGDPLFPGLGNGGYDVRSYALNLRYPTKDPKATVTGSVTVTAVATQALSTFDLDYAGGAVGAVTVNGQAATARRQGEELVVAPARPVPQGSTMVVAVDGLSAAPATSTGGLPGAHPFVATRDGTVLAGQPDGMHRFFPCNDHPSDKASFTFTVDVPAGWTAVANGDLVRRTVEGARVVWRYEQTRPMATELTQVAVGDFRVVERPDVDGVRLRDVVPRRIAGDLLPALAVQAEELRWLDRQLGPYPFGVYGALVVDARLGFALETQTLALFDATWFHPDPLLPQGPPDGVLLHEMAHQWFGDSVSPRAWSDVWLNEGHATWYAARWRAERGGAEGERWFRAQLRGLYRADARFRRQFGPPARPLAGAHLFSPSVYGGAELALYALRQTIGPPAFEQLERTWVREHRDGVASTADFMALASRVAGRDLTAFFDAWLLGATTPPLPALD